LATALLAGVGVFWFHSYIQNPKFIEEIRGSLSKMTGTEVRFQSLSVGLLSGVDLQRFQVPQPQNPKLPPFLMVEQIHLDYLPWKLLDEDLELEQAEFRKSQLNFRQLPDGRWNLPQFDRSAFYLTNRDPLRFKLNVRKLLWKDGAALALDSEENQVIRIQGSNIEGNLDFAQTGTTAEGSANILAVTLGDNLTFTELQGNYSLSNKVFRMPEIYGKAHGGLMRGKLEADFGPGGQSFSLQMALEKMDVSTILRDWGSRPSLASGKVNLETTLSGKISQPRLVQGVGKLKIESCEISGLQVMHLLAEILGIPDLASAKFNSLQGDFKVADQKLTFYNLEGVSDHLQLTGTGSFGFDQSLDFDMMLAIHPDLAAKIPAQLLSLFSVRDDKYLMITFKVNGTLREPDTNLIKKLLPEGAQKSLLQPLLDKLIKTPVPPAEAPAVPQVETSPEKKP